MTKDTELKPCPFCGGRAQISGLLSPEGKARGETPCWDVDCSVCWVHSRWNDEAEAIERWNRRASPPTPVREGLREEVARVIDPNADKYRGQAPSFHVSSSLIEECQFRWTQALAKADAILALTGGRLDPRQ